MKRCVAFSVLLLAASLPCARAAVVAVNVAPRADGGYDLDGNGSVDFRMHTHVIGTLALTNNSYGHHFEFQRGPGFAMAGRAGGWTPQLAALESGESVGAHSEWGDGASWTPTLYITTGGDSLMIGPGPLDEGFHGEFADKTEALVGYRITKDGMDYFGVLELELLWPRRVRPDLAAMPPGPSAELADPQPFTLVPSMIDPSMLVVGAELVVVELVLGVRIKGGWMETEAGKSFVASSVPEPGRGVLMLGGGVWLVLRRRRAALGAG